MLKMRPEDIIIKPIITEKSNMGVETGKYTFQVAKKATKIQIANAVQALFGVKVLNVNTIYVPFGFPVGLVTNSAESNIPSVINAVASISSIVFSVVADVAFLSFTK